MDSIFLVLVVFLLILACVDLFVGVSNDAVNFLNSAVGSRIAPLHIILIVASLGVLIGATFSSGMMEVARQGMFHPDKFTFYEVMIMFLAVMIADVLLLNAFNSLGLPTSTTVSIVFELFGAAICVAAYKLYSNGLPIAEIFDYIKSDRTMTIVSAILVSVVVAFVSGMVVQFVLRILFTFNFKNTYKYLGGLFCGFSLTAIIYFLVVKGAKDASFMKPEYINFINEHTQTILYTTFIVLTIISQIFVLFKINVFKLIILSGTFALAFSFAGNDLVNFIGVPLAALDSYVDWQNSGLGVDELMMTSLNETSKTPTFYLVIAGLIMAVTLFVSKKAHRVIQTSINLSSSSRGEHEQFGATTTGRMVTRMGLGVSRAVYNVMPDFALKFIGSRYQKLPVVKGEAPLPFDYVRASVNLVIAAILISSATSLKLPLSTTYVTFMVAMGSSFADGAWDRESAVYRISGVITVIAGWFLTGLSAFTFCFIICLVLLYLGTTAAFALIALALFIVIKSNFTKQKTTEVVQNVIDAKGDNAKILQAVSTAVPAIFENNVNCLTKALTEFFNDNEFALRKVRNKASNVVDSISRQRAEYYNLALQKDYSNKEALDAKHFFYLSFSNMLEGAKSVRYAVDQAVNHIANRHTLFTSKMQSSLEELLKRLDKVLIDMRVIAIDPSAINVENIVKHAKKLNRDIDKYQMELVNIIGHEKVSVHSAEMYLTFLQAIRDLANRYVAVAMHERALAQIVVGHKVDASLTQANMQSTIASDAIITNNEDLIKTPQIIDEDDSIEDIELPTKKGVINKK